MLSQSSQISILFQILRNCSKIIRFVPCMGNGGTPWIHYVDNGGGRHATFLKRIQKVNGVVYNLSRINIETGERHTINPEEIPSSVEIKDYSKPTSGLSEYKVNVRNRAISLGLIRETKGGICVNDGKTMEWKAFRNTKQAVNHLIYRSGWTHADIDRLYLETMLTADELEECYA